MSSGAQSELQVEFFDNQCLSSYKFSRVDDGFEINHKRNSQGNFAMNVYFVNDKGSLVTLHKDDNILPLKALETLNSIYNNFDIGSITIKKFNEKETSDHIYRDDNRERGIQKLITMVKNAELLEKNYAASKQDKVGVTVNISGTSTYSGTDYFSAVGDEKKG